MLLYCSGKDRRIKEFAVAESGKGRREGRSLRKKEWVVVFKEYNTDSNKSAGVTVTTFGYPFGEEIMPQKQTKLKTFQR